MGKILIIKGVDFSTNKLIQMKTFETPVISISYNGNVTITAVNALAIYYTINNETPTKASIKYTSDFIVDNNTIVKAVAVYNTGVSDISIKTFQKTIIEWNPTRIGKYISEGGHEIGDGERYDSMLIQLTPAKTYIVHQQRGSNNIRVFIYNNDVYTQIISSQDGEFVYECPNDGNSYVLQFVYDNMFKEESPGYVEII